MKNIKVECAECGDDCLINLEKYENEEFHLCDECREKETMKKENNKMNCSRCELPLEEEDYLICDRCLEVEKFLNKNPFAAKETLE